MKGSVLHVSPTGDDGHSGATRRAAFATLTRARDAARNLPRPVTIVLEDGVHRLSEPLALTPEDSDLTLTAAPGARPVISGGARISGWRRQGQGPLWIADVPWLKERAEPFSQLFVNGARRPCARTPNAGAYFYTQRLTLTRGDPGECLGFTYNREDKLPWLTQPGVRVVLFHNWVNSYNRAQSVDPQTRRVVFTRPAGIFFLGPEARYYVENSLDALDAPGEWFADRAAGRLYYYPLPGERMARAEVIAPIVVSSLIVITGEPQAGRYVERLTFRGLSFQHTDAHLAPDYPHSVQGAHTQRGAIFAKGLRESTIEDCVFTRLGEHGVSLREYCHANVIQRSRFHDLGGGGIYLSAGSPTHTHDAYLTSHTIVDNNFIHDGGHIFRAGCGIFLGGSASHNRITHNEISNLSWTGVHLGWSWTGKATSYTHHNIVAYNHIHHLGNGVLNDIGGIYTLGVSPGTVLKHNHIHNITRFERGREGYGGWGIYLDAGSAQITVSHNLAHDTRDGGLHLHNDGHPWGNLVTNNIFAFSRGAELIRNASRSHTTQHVALVHNIVYGPSAKIYGGNNWRPGCNFHADRNLYWSATTNAPVFFWSDFKTWQAEGRDRNARIADPLFVDAGARDFRLRPGSPAFALGIAPVDVSKAGLHGSRSWTRLPRTVAPRPVELAAASPKTALRNTFEDEAPGDLPDFLRVSEENTQAVARVVAAGVAGPSQSLRVTDGPGQQHEYQPHFYYEHEFPEGLLRGAFDLRHETGAIFLYEWRDWTPNKGYHSGPILRVNADGALLADGRHLLTVPAGQWVHVEILAGTGPQAEATWQLAVTLPGQTPRRFENLPRSADFKRLNWVGGVSLATTETVFYLDNMVVEAVQP